MVVEDILGSSANSADNLISTVDKTSCFCFNLSGWDLGVVLIVLVLQEDRLRYDSKFT